MRFHRFKKPKQSFQKFVSSGSKRLTIAGNNLKIGDYIILEEFENGKRTGNTFAILVEAKEGNHVWVSRSSNTNIMLLRDVEKYTKYEGRLIATNPIHLFEVMYGGYFMGNFISLDEIASFKAKDVEFVSIKHNPFPSHFIEVKKEENEKGDKVVATYLGSTTNI